MTALSGARWILGLLLASGLGAACGSDRPVEISSIQVGKSRNADKTIAQQTFEFKPEDTIYAAAIVEGRGSNVKISARWIMPGGMVNESEQVVSPRDRTVAPFELRSAGGFPPGKYSLEVSLNGVPAGTKEIHVK